MKLINVFEMHIIYCKLQRGNLKAKLTESLESLFLITERFFLLKI